MKYLDILRSVIFSWLQFVVSSTLGDPCNKVCKCAARNFSISLHQHKLLTGGSVIKQAVLLPESVQGMCGTRLGTARSDGSYVEGMSGIEEERTRASASARSS